MEISLMRKGLVLGITASIIATIGCLAVWHTSTSSLKVMHVADATVIKEALDMVSGPRVVSLTDFDPYVLKMSYPAMHEGIPLLVGALAKLPPTFEGDRLNLHSRLTIDFDGTESGDLVFQGVIPRIQLAPWLDRVMENFAPWKNRDVPFFYCEMYLVGAVTMAKTDGEVPDGSWLIEEQTHYMIRVIPYHSEIDVNASIRLEEDFYREGEAFEFHVASLKYSGPDDVDQQRLNEYSFFGVIEE